MAQELQIGLPQNEKAYIWFGWIIVLVGILGFILWAAYAPLDKGVTVSGSVIVSGYRKTVQSPATGVIKQVNISEGDEVITGQVLIELNKISSEAQLASLKDKYFTLLATQERLQAEKNDVNKIQFSSFLTKDQDFPHINKIITLQKQLFLSRRQALNSQIDSHQYAIDGMEFEIKTLKASLTSKKIQRSTLVEQVNNMKQLADDGYLPRNRYLEISRQLSDIDVGIDGINGRLGQLISQNKEARQKIVLLQAEYQKEVNNQLSQVEIDIEETGNKLKVANFDHQLMSITAPVSGNIIDSGVFTTGSVIKMGDVLMDIIPKHGTMIVEAHLPLNLIDKVAKGLSVELRFTALNQNITPRISGEVMQVSADKLFDKKTGEAYYKIQVAVSPGSKNILHADSIKPGMPVEVFIKTGERSLLNYLLKPLSDRVYYALSEE